MMSLKVCVNVRYITSPHIALAEACHMAKPKVNETCLLFFQEVQQDIYIRIGRSDFSPTKERSISNCGK